MTKGASMAPNARIREDGEVVLALKTGQGSSAGPLSRPWPLAVLHQMLVPVRKGQIVPADCWGGCAQGLGLDGASSTSQCEGEIFKVALPYGIS